jgi:hypothetical protein
MSKLHELKIKYEQSQLAERAAWSAWLRYGAGWTALRSDEAYRDYRDASNAWRQASCTVDEDAMAYLEELNRFHSFNMKVLCWAAVIITVVVTFGMIIT